MSLIDNQYRIENEGADSLNQQTWQPSYITDLELVELEKSDRNFKELILEGRQEGESLPFMLEQTDGVFAVLVFCFLFFAHMFNGGFNYLKDNYRLLYSTGHFGQREYSFTTQESTYSYFLVFQSLFLISIILYDVFMQYMPLNVVNHSPFVTILLFTLFMAAYLLLKLILYRFIGFVFDTKLENKIWLRSYFVIIEILGIIFFFPTLFVVYANYGSSYIVTTMLVLLVLAHLVYFYRRIYYFIQKKFSFLYLIAYLCTIELLPCVFLAIGIVFIYKLDVSDLLWLLK